MMSVSGVRVLHRGVQQPIGTRKVAIGLILLMLLPIINPSTAEESAGKNDFGVLEAMADALSEQRDSGEDDLARNSAEGIISAVEAKGLSLIHI